MSLDASPCKRFIVDTLDHCFTCSFSLIFISESLLFAPFSIFSRSISKPNILEYLEEYHLSKSPPLPQDKSNNEALFTLAPLIRCSLILL